MNEPHEAERDLEGADERIETLLRADALSPLERRLVRDRVLAAIRVGRRRRTLFRLSILPAAAAGLLLGIVLARLVLPPITPEPSPDAPSSPVAEVDRRSDQSFRVAETPHHTPTEAFTPVAMGGAVLDPHGLPLAGARISGAWQPHGGTVVADETGHFLLRVHPPETANSVFHVAAPPGSGLRPVLYHHAPGRRVELSLPEARPLQGCVTNAETGERLRRARVDLSVLWQGRVVHRETTTAGLAGFRLSPTPVVHTSAGFAAPRSLILQFAVHSRGYIPLVAQFRSAEALEEALARPVAMVPAARVAVRVITPSGRPLPGARVQLVPLDQDRTAFTYEAPGGPRTGENGIALLEGVTPGRVRVIVHHPDALAPAVTEIEAAAGRTTEVEFPMQPGRQLAGRVVDPEGRPLAGARVFATLEAGPDAAPSFARGPIETGLDGRFAFSGLAPGHYEVRVFRTPFVGREDAAATCSGVASGRRDLEVVLASSPVDLHLRVRDARDDRPITRCAVTLLGPGGATVRAPDAIRDGAIVLRGVDPSRTAIQVRAAGYLPSVLHRIDPDERQDVIELGVRLEPPAKLAGILVDTAGRPLTGAMIMSGHEEVEPIRPDGRGFHTARKPRIAVTDDRGRFALTGLRAREGAGLGVSLVVLQPGRPPITLPAVRLLPGESREDVRLELRP